MASQYRRRSLMLNTIAKVAQGNPTIITDSSSRRLQKLNIYGQSEQDGTPSVENPIPIISKEVSEIKITGKNLVAYPYLNNEGASSGVTFKVNEDGTINVSGTAQNNNAYFNLNNYDFGEQDIIVSPMNEKATIGEYTLSANCKDTNTNVVYNAVNGLLYVFVVNGQTVKGTLKIQVERGNKATSYEPYKSQTITLPDPITLRGIPVDNGGNITIDGQQYIADYIDSLTGKVNRLNGYIDSYNGEEVGTIYMSTTGELSTGAKVIYKLSQPTQEDLPQQDQEAIRALTTYYPNTVIQTGCWNEVTYSAKRGG